ncbi:unnamed protein product [[Actinomadura] parvosata subsp. kistnae]|nr:unnamed protein product [Actinomadura parvosata subsp. kistnae]
MLVQRDAPLLKWIEGHVGAFLRARRRATCPLALPEASRSNLWTLPLEPPQSVMIPDRPGMLRHD